MSQMEFEPATQDNSQDSVQQRQQKKIINVRVGQVGGMVVVIIIPGAMVKNKKRQKSYPGRCHLWWCTTVVIIYWCKI